MKALTAARWAAATFAPVVFFGLAACVLWFFLKGPGYYWELNDIKAEFRKTPGVELLDAGGYDDITLTRLWAEIRVKGKGGMTFMSLTRKSFKDAPDVCLAEVGPYRFIIRGKTYFEGTDGDTGKRVRDLTEFYGTCIDVGPEGEFSGLIPFPIRNVRDAIAHYDDIRTALSGWPVAPDSRRIDLKDGAYCIYSLAKPDNS